MNNLDGPDTGRILLIDEDEREKKVFEETLETHGYETRYTPEVAEGLKIIGEWRPSVILLNFSKPDPAGVDACRRIRQLKLNSRPSIILVSKKGDMESVVSSLSNGADDFIIRPVKGTELLARVKEQLKITRFYKELAEDRKSLETILEITNAISATLDPTEVLRTIVEKVAAATGAVRCSIVLIARDDEAYVLASHDDPTLKDLKIDLAKYPEIREVINTKNPLALEDMVNHPLMSAVREKILQLKDMSILIVPIVFNDQVLGTLFLRTKKKAQGFTRDEVDFCRIVANASYYAIKNASVYQRVIQERENLKEAAIKDHLTGLYNHNYFYSRLEEEFERSRRYETALSLIMMDIDNFKKINDSYGHRTGDDVLKGLAATIKGAVRKSDIVARYGGEEFAIILPHTGTTGAAGEAERLRTRIEKVAFAGIKERVTVSFGVASLPDRNINEAGDLVGRADDALYEAKKSGRNCVKVADGQ